MQLGVNGKIARFLEQDFEIATVLVVLITIKVIHCILILVQYVNYYC
jgi:hypothetical protein